VKYAAAQRGLGDTYQNLSEEIPEKCEAYIKSAIECYIKALEIFQKDSYPEGYIIMQINLGNAYRQLAEILDDEFVASLE